MKNLLLLSLLAFGTLMGNQKAWAIDPKNPWDLCERFMEGAARSKCQSRIEELKPDWYLATVCSENFDDQLFYDCLSINKAGSFDPKKLEECTGDQLMDSARNSCVRKALIGAAKAFQDTQTHPKKKSAKKH